MDLKAKTGTGKKVENENEGNLGLALAGGTLAAVSMMAAASNPSSSVSGPSGPSGASGERGKKSNTTKDGAYRAGLPCKNTQCKSYGMPHPNCRCYPGFAKGGEVGSYCDEDRAHKSGCQYFADGGDVEEFELSPAAKEEEFELSPTAKEEKLELSPNVEGTSDTAEKVGTAAENFAKGYLGPLATGAQTAMGMVPGLEALSREKQVERAEKHPDIALGSEIAGLGTGVLTGTGLAGLAGKIGPAAGGIAALPLPNSAYHVGSQLISALIQGGIISGGDEVSKYILGQGPGLSTSAMYTLEGGLWNLVGSALGIPTGVVASKFGKAGSRALAFIEGFGTGSPKVVGRPNYSQTNSFNSGVRIREMFSGPNVMERLLVPAGGIAGGARGIWQGATGDDNMMDKINNVIFSGLTGLGIGTAAKYGGPLILKLAVSDKGQKALSAADNLSEFFTKVEKGQNRVTRGIEALFKTATPFVKLPEEDRQRAVKEMKKLRDKADKYINNGGAFGELKDEAAQSEDPQNFAEGGEVRPMGDQNYLAEFFPDQNMAINETKMRMSNYLSSLRPDDIPIDKPVFEDFSPDPDKIRDYERALDIAIDPLMILSEIQNGTLQNRDITHLVSMYPDVGNLLVDRMTQRITQAQLKGQKPPYAVRQAMSVFLGTPLTADMKPGNIRAAQNVFQAKKQALAAAPVKKTSPLNKASIQHLGNLDARTKRGQKQ